MTPVLANMGVPMIFPQAFLMSIAFLPVVLIEAVLVRKAMALSLRTALKDVAIANLWTTLLGVPVAWLSMLLIELFSTTGGTALGMDTPIKMLTSVTLQAAWLVPYEDHLFWMIPAAATALLIPCFIASLGIECWVLARRWSDRGRAAVFSAVLRANVWSYIFLFSAGSLWTVSTLI